MHQKEIYTDVLLDGSTFQDKQKKKGMQNEREKGKRSQCDHKSYQNPYVIRILIRERWEVERINMMAGTNRTKDCSLISLCMLLEQDIITLITELTLLLDIHRRAILPPAGYGYGYVIA
ncbi:uncharacterized protein LOC121802393 [Salvia splendens]|uniref:uncharacterized protein LOC121802393 n=1 Tax=Salvia splendens TaxID=180675 RepID=UPI001C271DDA|nr:uncharacterized protein LOC121802393 [Salvia splendens]